MSVKNVKVSASVLNADLSALGEEVGKVERAGASLLHIDVMDGVFVPPMTFGDVVTKSLRKKSSLIFDVHLMVKNPENLIERFAQAGSDMISIHVESDCDVAGTLARIRRPGLKAGLAINPSTPIESVYTYLGLADMFIIMSVNPGYGGQAFIPESTEKIAALRNEAAKRGVPALIEVDGGINENTAPDAVKAGADILVAGTYLFNSSDMSKAVESLKNS